MTLAFKTYVCVVKKTAYDHYHQDPTSVKSFCRLSEGLQARIRRSHENQERFLRLMHRQAKKLQLKIDFYQENELDQIKADATTLILSCGGDGTFLSCAQSFPHSVLLGLNSDFSLQPEYQGSVGALTSVTILDLSHKLKLLAENKGSLEQWSRLGAKINDQSLPRLAVNEIFLGNPVSFLTSNITVETEQSEEDFNCNGLLVCTGMGSNAWFSAAGGSTFNNDLQAFGYLILLPSHKWKPKFSSGICSYKNRLIVRPHRDDYVLAFDSKPETYALKAGDSVSFFLDRENSVRVLKLA